MLILIFETFLILSFAFHPPNHLHPPVTYPRGMYLLLQ